MIQLINLSVLMLVCTVSAQAGELVYEPVNPAFGGSPLNGNWLLNNAQAQNSTTDPAENEDVEERTALDRFNDTMERLVLSRLSTAVVDQFTIKDVDTGIYSLVAGSYQIGDFQVDILDTADGLTTITTTDKTTGQSTHFVIEQHSSDI